MRKMICLCIVMLVHSLIYAQKETLSKTEKLTILKEINLEKNLNKKEILLNKLENQTKDLSQQNKDSIDQEKKEIAEAYAKQQDWDKAIQWLTKIQKYALGANLARSFAAQLVASEQPKKALAVLQPFLKEILETQRKGFFELDAYYTRRVMIDYGKILLNTGDYESAIPYLAPHPIDTDLIYENELTDVPPLYAMALGGANKGSQADLALRNVLKTGNADEKLKAVARAFYLKYTNSDKVYTNLIDSIHNDMSQKLQPQMVKIPAANFELTDLEGKSVSLQDLKGKIVVLDFWATWCDPCTYSLPAMQKAAQYFSNDPSVVFLFIHTWEEKKLDKEAALAQVKKFVQEENYSFRVLMDYRDKTSERKTSKAAEAYKLQGIPAKFVIDKNGFIRFDNKLKMGKDNLLVENLKLAVELVKKEN